MAGPKKGGCFLYGCAIATVIAIIISVVLGWFLIRQMKGAVTLYTSPVATPLPTVSFSEDDARRGMEKVGRLKSVVRDPRGSGEFDFTAPEINGVIATDGSLSNVRNRLNVAIEGSEAIVRFSTRLSELGPWPGVSFLSADDRNRYLNGEAKGVMSIARGIPSLQLSTLILGGKEFPDVALSQASKWISGALESLGQEEQGKIRRFLSRIDLMQIKDGHLMMSVKPIDSSHDAQP
jgi:hypothetical protein